MSWRGKRSSATDCYAARVLAQAEKLPGRTLIYLCGDAPPELLAGKVAAERVKFETGAQPTGD